LCSKNPTTAAPQSKDRITPILFTILKNLVISPSAAMMHVKSKAAGSYFIFVLIHQLIINSESQSKASAILTIVTMISSVLLQKPSVSNRFLRAFAQLVFIKLN
jgi:hypothetical protein